MELSPLTKKDFKELLVFIRKASPGLEFLNPAVLEEQTLSDPDGDPSYLIKASEKNRLIGAAIGCARKMGAAKVGFIKYAAVDPKKRGQGVGQALFSEMERRFQKREARESQVGGCPPPFLQGGVPASDTATVSFLLKRGYQKKGDIVDMTAPLGRWKPQEKEGDQALVKQFKLRRAASKDEAMLLEFASAHFPHWAYEIRQGLKKGRVFMAEEGGKAVAFCCGDATNPGFFGPMGTAEALRGKGLARILLNQTLQAMKKSGHKSARIPWVGPIPFYAKYAGASLGPLYWQFGKHL